MQTRIVKPLYITALAATTLAFAAVPALAQPPGQTYDMGAPIGTAAQVRADLEPFLALFPYHMFPAGPPHIYQSRSGWFGAQVWARRLPSWLRNTSIRILDETVDVTDAHTASVEVTYEVQNHATGAQAVEAKTTRLFEASELVPLKFDLAADGITPIWKVVAPETDPGHPPAQPHSFHLINWLAYHLAQKPGSEPPDDPPLPAPTIDQQALQHLQHLASGVFIFVNDHHDQYCFAAKYADEALRPYIGDESLWTVPPSTFRFDFNGHLSGHKVGEVPVPASTVLFYDGTNDTPHFRYDGKAAVGFADGHCKLITPNEAKKLIWDPFAEKAP